MSVWIEIHCDYRFLSTDEEFAVYGLNWGCRDTQHAEHPAGMAFNTQSSIDRVFKFIKQEAVETGWQFIKGNWACKRCARILNNAPRS
jgi:hypothetical protein